MIVNKNNTRVLEVIIKADERLVHVNSYTNGHWGQETNIAGKVEPQRDFSLKFIREKALIKIFFNGVRIEEFEYSDGENYLNLYADPYKGFINQVVEG